MKVTSVDFTDIMKKFAVNLIKIFLKITKSILAET